MYICHRSVVIACWPERALTMRIALPSPQAIKWTRGGHIDDGAGVLPRQPFLACAKHLDVEAGHWVKARNVGR